ncbi:hypothetical protein L1987_78222 [Smallanthus sonchifolius]|uniref:Uncharacterized protein n=1 Tax=Smallanthus sonchifolius TaxID=185202 RepID=A0ACB8ZGJ0_9ASTR|nr:hypothetical protein L1987_78222 [Smallanthus sonchifolius]
MPTFTEYGLLDKRTVKEVEEPKGKLNIKLDRNQTEQLSEALARVGLESSNLILCIDYTKSNEWIGSRSFQRKSLHHIRDGLNPFEMAISIIGKTLAAFDEDNLIPYYGFGDGIVL